MVSYLEAITPKTIIEIHDNDKTWVTYMVTAIQFRGSDNLCCIGSTKINNTTITKSILIHSWEYGWYWKFPTDMTPPELLVAEARKVQYKQEIMQHLGKIQTSMDAIRSMLKSL